MNKLFTLGSLLGFMFFGSVANAHFVDSDPNHGHVCTESTSLSVRNTPYTDYNGNPEGQVIGSVKKGQQVKIKGSYSNWENQDINSYWYHIYMNNGKEGYISGDYVCF